MTFIAEHSEGKATDGFNPILELIPASLHKKAPFFTGSPQMVNLVMHLIRYNPNHNTDNPND
jgi:fructose-1,6-bisphosphatase I